MNAVLYGVDTRASREIEDLTASIGAETIFARCGNALTSQSVGPKILWLKRNRPDIYARVHKFLNSTSFLVHRLTGRFVTTITLRPTAVRSISSTSRRWSGALAPEITELDRLPGTRLDDRRRRRRHSARRERTGLAAGDAGHRRHDRRGGRGDQRRRSSIAGDMMMMYGSTIFIILITPERARDPRLWQRHGSFPGQHACMAGLATSGALDPLVCDQFARELDP